MNASPLKAFLNPMALDDGQKLLGHGPAPLGGHGSLASSGRSADGRGVGRPERFPAKHTGTDTAGERRVRRSGFRADAWPGLGSTLRPPIRLTAARSRAAAACEVFGAAWERPSISLFWTKGFMRVRRGLARVAAQSCCIATFLLTRAHKSIINPPSTEKQNHNQ